MALPVVLAGLIVASALGKIIGTGASIYQTYQETENADVVNNYVKNYGLGYYAENTRYWNDYIQRHHLGGRDVKYPYRMGYNYNMGGIYSADASLKNNELSRQMSWFRLLGGGGLGQGPSLYRGLGGE